MDHFLFFFLLDNSSQRVLHYHGVNLADNNEDVNLDNLMDFTTSLVHFFMNFGSGELKAIELNVCRVVTNQRDGYLFGLMAGLAIPTLDAEFKLNTIVSLLLSEKDRFFTSDGKQIQNVATVNSIVERVLLGDVIDLSERARADIQQLIKEWTRDVQSWAQRVAKVSVALLSFSGSVLIEENADVDLISNAQEIISIIHSEGIVQLEFFSLISRRRMLMLYGVTSGLFLLVAVQNHHDHAEEKALIGEVENISKKIRSLLAN